jgi:hypothetical protein
MAVLGCNQNSSLGVREIASNWFTLFQGTSGPEQTTSMLNMITTVLHPLWEAVCNRPSKAVHYPEYGSAVTLSLYTMPFASIPAQPAFAHFPETVLAPRTATLLLRDGFNGCAGRMKNHQVDPMTVDSHAYSSSAGALLRSFEFHSEEGMVWMGS